MFIDRAQCRKARVIRESAGLDGKIRRETIMDGIAVSFTSVGAFIFNPKEQEGENPACAEWFPYESKEGIKTIVYC